MSTESRRRHLSSSPFAPRAEPVPQVFEVGDRVSHDTYGLGRVVQLEGDRAVHIDFGGTKTRVPLPARTLMTL